MPKFHVSRSIDVEAPVEKVFEVVSDFNTWTTWSPWLIAEPEADVTITGDGKSVGATYHWSGQVTGEGIMTHQVLDAPHRIVSDIKFLRPMQSVSEVSFDLVGQGNKTTVHWNMDGSLPWFLFWMTKSMDTWIGLDYERGLRMLKEWIEQGAIHSRVQIQGVETVQAIRMAGIRETVRLSEIGPAMEKAFRVAQDELKAAGIPLDGAVLSVYHTFDMKSKRTNFTSGFQVPEGVELPHSLSEWSLPTSSAFHVEHLGPYEHLANAWSAAHQHVRSKRMKPSKVGTFEIYRNSPHDTPPEELLTDVYLPLR